MPCPYFEPRQAVVEPEYPNARLPLILEFDGVCRASAETEPRPVPPQSRLRYCNHGNAKNHCALFPPQDPRSCIRFEVLRRSAVSLDLLVVEESLYTPISWIRSSFSIADEKIEPPPPDICRQAQTLAFCRGYLQAFPLTKS